MYWEGKETSLMRFLSGRKLLIMSIFFSATALLLSSCATQDKGPPPIATWKIPTPTPPPNPDVPYSDVNYEYPLSQIHNARLYVYKNDRRLLLVNDGILVRDYRIGLGRHPSGDKFMQGDGRTPEGEFFICMKNLSSKFYKSLGLSYPDKKRAEEAYLTGCINQNQFKCILEAIDQKSLPPPNTPLGGAIFIHGGGGHLDWTEGCVAVFNSAMDELFDVVSVGTPVKIMP